MAQKRMFDKAIIETDSFLNVSLTAKALYFLLGMEADDEGFVSPNRIIRLYGGEIGDLKNLSDVGLIIPFNSGVVVITDWKQNNWLDSRRIKSTQYQNEKKMLICSHGKYMLSNCLARGEERRGEQIGETEVSQGKLSSGGKNTIIGPGGKEYQTRPVDDDGEFRKTPQKKYPNAHSVFALFGKYPLNWKLNKTQLTSAENLFVERGIEQIKKALVFYKENQRDSFCPTILTPYDLDSKWANLTNFRNKNANP